MLERKVLPAWPVRLLVARAAAAGAARGGRRARARAPPPRARRRVARAGSRAALPAVRARGAVRDRALPQRACSTRRRRAGRRRGAVAVGGAALAAVLVVLALGWLVLRPLLVRARRACGRAAPGAGAATATRARAVRGRRSRSGSRTRTPRRCSSRRCTCGCSRSRPRSQLRARASALLLFAVGLLPPLLVAYAYARQFGLGPLELAWTRLLLVAGGGIGLADGAAVVGRARAARAAVLRDRLRASGGAAAAPRATPRSPCAGRRPTPGRARSAAPSRRCGAEPAARPHGDTWSMRRLLRARLDRADRGGRAA